MKKIISRRLCCIMLLIVGSSLALSPLTTATTSPAKKVSDRSRTQVNLGSSYSPEPPKQQQRWIEYITKTDLDLPTLVEHANKMPDSIPPRLKVVVFGATGRIGRRIVHRLMSAPIDMDVVAFVRNMVSLFTIMFMIRIGENTEIVKYLNSEHPLLLLTVLGWLTFHTKLGKVRFCIIQ